MITKKDFTWVSDDVCVCNNCGAHADSPKNIVCYKSCKKDKSKFWEQYYNEEDK